MRLKARATGNLSTTNLKLDSQLKQQAEYQKPTTPVEIPIQAIRRIQIRAEAVKHLTRLPKGKFTTEDAEDTEKRNNLW